MLSPCENATFLHARTPYVELGVVIRYLWTSEGAIIDRKPIRGVYLDHATVSSSLPAECCDAAHVQLRNPLPGYKMVVVHLPKMFIGVREYSYHAR